MNLREKLEEVRQNGYASVKGGILVSSTFVDDITAAAVTSIVEAMQDTNPSEDTIREWMKTWVAYSETGPSFDPKGKYLCGTCALRIDNGMRNGNECAPMSGVISLEAGSCRMYVHGPNEEAHEPYKHQLTQIEAQYGERPKTKAFGCARCKYGSKAEPDAQGRPSMCSYFNVHVVPLACCAMNEGDDSIQPKEVAASSEEGWHGVDLDGTIAEYHGFKGISHIGKPIEGQALERVKDWLKKGERVKIFTARDIHKDPKAIKYIQDWTEKYLGQRLEVTDSKDQDMIDLLDDLATHVETNTGKITSATEQSLPGGTLWNGIRIVGFTGPEEEALRALLSRIPPELLVHVTTVQSASELNAKHGRYEDHKILFNPTNLTLRQSFGTGELPINHADLTIVHEVGHSLHNSLTPEESNEWNEISGWMKGTKEGQAPPYEERRPGWEPMVSKYTHKFGATFPRYYAEKNPGEDFSDCFAFFLMNKAHMIGDDKQKFFDTYIQNHVHRYPHASIESPVSAAGTSEGVRKAWDTRGRGRKPYQKAAERIRRRVQLRRAIHQLVTDQPRVHTTRAIVPSLRRRGFSEEDVRHALRYLERNRNIAFEPTTEGTGRRRFVMVPRRPLPSSVSTLPPVARPSAPNPDRYSPWQHPAPPETSIPTLHRVPEDVRVGSAAANSGLNVLRDGEWHTRQAFDNAIVTHNERSGTSFDSESRLGMLRERLPERGYRLEERYSGTSPEENQIRVVPNGTVSTPTAAPQTTVQAPVSVPAPQRINNPASGQRQPLGFLKQDQATLDKISPNVGDEYSAKGIRISSSNLTRFKDKFGMTPDNYRDTLFKGIDKSIVDGVTMRIDSSGNTWQINASGAGLEINRSIDLQNKSVYHGYFTMSESMQGQGLAKQIFANSLDIYDHLGLETIGVSASLAGGGYAWARFGFVPDRSGWQSVASNAVYKADRDMSITPEMKASIKLISKIEDPRAIWLLASLKDAKGDSIGGKLLRGTDWHGTLKLNDPEQYAIVRDYSGRETNVRRR